ncbi:hypothetical protein [Ramlibacter tataouinensis]|uniref:Uncharacterized protein n=1 Tax=Ramlibacter tataouinensis (strain ATCC BAA-407 / DSM 14655 / LMG 21543 / TTB310) TaxID=365046 RepID=F5XVY2_RAMTT|nr:hypothetical protein [Ramlibacter tataouinensis]AEG94085.1 hypothetical protein Rta_29810 [Ramlibacter tataouinensis TTB310]
MADPEIRSLRTLAEMRRRRGKALEKDLAQQRAELERCMAASEAARTQRDDCIARHQQALEARSRMLDHTFTSAHIRTADLEIETRVSHKGDADKAVRRLESVAQRQQQLVLAAQAAWRRNQERLERFDAQIGAALKARQVQEDEASDEEAEEMATVRVGGRRRQPGDPAGHV